MTLGKITIDNSLRYFRTTNNWQSQHVSKQALLFSKGDIINQTQEWGKLQIITFHKRTKSSWKT